MKLTIITVAYNNLEGLKKTAETVWKQTARDFAGTGKREGGERSETALDDLDFKFKTF